MTNIYLKGVVVHPQLHPIYINLVYFLRSRNNSVYPTVHCDTFASFSRKLIILMLRLAFYALHFHMLSYLVFNFLFSVFWVSCICPPYHPLDFLKSNWDYLQSPMWIFIMPLLGCQPLSIVTQSDLS